MKPGNNDKNRRKKEEKIKKEKKKIQDPIELFVIKAVHPSFSLWYVFSPNRPLGRFGLVVAMSVHMLSPQASFFSVRGSSLALVRTVPRPRVEP